MTNLFNHGRIETEICNALEKVRKDHIEIGMMILDLDHFKCVNDEHGCHRPPIMSNPKVNVFCHAGTRSVKVEAVYFVRTPTCFVTANHILTLIRH